MGLAEKIRLDSLYILYSQLFTNKQRDVLQQYFIEDFSITEIAENLQVTRQAVHEVIKKASIQLEKYESKLGILSNNEERDGMLRQIKDICQNALKDRSGSPYADLEKIMELIKIGI